MENTLKAYVRHTRKGKIIPGSLKLSKVKPTIGNWVEININECCNYAPPINLFNFDLTALWDITTPPVTDAASFKEFLESGKDALENINDLTGVVVTDFLLEGNRLRCNVSSTGPGYLGLSGMGITNITSFGNLDISQLFLEGNNIISVNNVIWPTSLTLLNLDDNEIVNFNPSQSLPDSLSYLFFSYNQVVDFNPSQPLPSSLISLRLDNNKIVNFNPLQPLPDSLISLSFGYNEIVDFNPSIPLPSSLIELYLDRNKIVIFNPSIPLPDSLSYLLIRSNLITDFNPTLSLPSSLIELNLGGNQIINFNPSTPLPNSLTKLGLERNEIVIFNPSTPLPTAISELNLARNLMTTAGYTATEFWANTFSVIPGRGEIKFGLNINSVNGTNLQTILISKGWTVTP